MKSLLDYIKEDIFDVDQEIVLRPGEEVGYQTTIANRDGNTIKISADEGSVSYINYSYIQLIKNLGISKIECQRYLILMDDTKENKLNFNGLLFTADTINWRTSGEQLPIKDLIIENLNIKATESADISHIGFRQTKSLHLKNCNIIGYKGVGFTYLHTTFDNVKVKTQLLEINNFPPMRELLSEIPAQSNNSIDKEPLKKWGLYINDCKFVDIGLRINKNQKIVLHLKKSSDRSLNDGWDRLGKSDWIYYATLNDSITMKLSLEELKKYIK